MMKIAGIQKISMVDYPGVICATIFTQGCNFRCGFCHNRDLVPASSDYEVSQQEIFKYLDEKRNMIDGVCITGGEPTLWKDLPDFIRQVKERGFKVKLDTNGSNPDMLDKLFLENLLDFIAVDVKTSLEKYHFFNAPDEINDKFKESVQKIISSDVAHEFRTTCVPGIVGEEDIISISQTIKGAGQYALQQFKASENVLDSKYSEMKPYNKNELDSFKKIAEKNIDNVVIRGI